MVMGRYRLTKRLGSGAFGTVWSARDERLDRDVAVKLLPRERVIHARFEREARAAARLQHPAIVTLYEAAVDDEGAYLVSELVRGRTLDTLARARASCPTARSSRSASRSATRLITPTARASSTATSSRRTCSCPIARAVGGGRAGSRDRAKLTDFGVAHVIGGATLTRTGDVVGTLAYMAPEQADGREVGPEADLYSLALVLYEALTGVNPLASAAAACGGGTHVRAAAATPAPRPAAGRSPPASTRRCGRARASAARSRTCASPLLESLDRADDARGVVAPGWRGRDEDDTWVQGDARARVARPRGRRDPASAHDRSRSQGRDRRPVGRSSATRRAHEPVLAPACGQRRRRWPRHSLDLHAALAPRARAARRRGPGGGGGRRCCCRCSARC